MARQNRNGPMGSPCLTPDAERIGSVPLINRLECCLSITLPHPRENVGEVLFHLPWKKAGLLTELNAFTMSSETSTQPEWWSLRRFSHTVHYILCSSWNTHTLNCTGEKKPGSFLRLHITAELACLWKMMVPIAMGLTPPSFLAIGISLAPKKYGLRVVLE